MLLRLFTAACLGLASVSITAQEHHQHNAGAAHQGVSIASAWSRAMPPTAPNGAAYFELTNQAEEPERILGAVTDIAETVELHNHVHADGLMRMERVDVVEVAAQGSVQFKPGSYHVMLLGLKQPLVAGERFSLTVELEKAGAITTDVEILREAPGSESSAGHGHSHH